MTPPLPEFDFDVALRHLTKADPILGGVIARVGPCELVRRGRVVPFHALARSIIYQQLHGRAAAAIHGRMLALFSSPRLFTPAGLLALPDAPLRAAGLSASKLASLRDLAAKTADGTVPTFAATHKLSDEELIERLIAVRGIGPWTVHMLLIFHLGRLDVLPTGDYAVRKAFSRLYRKRGDASIAQIERHAARWRPYRSVASWYLWRSLDLPEKSGAD